MSVLDVMDVWIAIAQCASSINKLTYTHTYWTTWTLENSALCKMRLICKAIKKCVIIKTIILNSERSTEWRDAIRAFPSATGIILIGIFTQPDPYVAHLCATRQMRLNQISVVNEYPLSGEEWSDLHTLCMRSNIWRLPDSVENWAKLYTLNLDNCRYITHLPEASAAWKQLRSLSLMGCGSFMRLPEAVSQWENLNELKLGSHPWQTQSCPLTELPIGIGMWVNLDTLIMTGTMITRLHDGAKNWRKIHQLILAGSPVLESLPDGIDDDWRELSVLCLENCPMVQGAQVVRVSLPQPEPALRLYGVRYPDVRKITSYGRWSTHADIYDNFSTLL
jgi:hypothetical protein